MIKHLAYTFKEWLKIIFLYPTNELRLPDSSDYDLYWQRKRGRNMGALSSWQKERSDFIVNMIKKRRKTDIVVADVGCGDGSILIYLKEKLNCVTHCIGYDKSKIALDFAREFGIETHLLDLSDTEDFSHLKRADYYLLLETLEHIIDSEELLLQTLSNAEEGVFFSFPNSGYFTHRLRMMFGKTPLQWKVFPNEHIRFWTKRDLLWWLKALSLGKACTIHYYKGIPVLNRLLPGLFAAAFVVFVDSRVSRI